MTSAPETLDHTKLLENSSSGRAPVNGSQGVACSHPIRENAPPLLEKAQQRERLALLGTSAVIFAHEVGNPLHAIFGSLEFIETELKKRQNVEPVLISMIEGAIRETDRLRTLLRQFRSLANGQNLDLQLVDLAKVIEEVLALQRFGHLAAGIAVKLECERTVPLVMLDRAKITQAILNLCKNAVEAMPNGGCLTIKMLLSGPTIVMAIADTGVGMPDGINAFQLFVTTKPAGSGLGLPVVQQIIAAHKGTINYVTQLGHGTTFTVILPLEERK